MQHAVRRVGVYHHRGEEEVVPQQQHGAEQQRPGRPGGQQQQEVVAVLFGPAHDPVLRHHQGSLPGERHALLSVMMEWHRSRAATPRDPMV